MCECMCECACALIGANALPGPEVNLITPGRNMISPGLCLGGPGALFAWISGAMKGDK